MPLSDHTRICAVTAGEMRELDFAAEERSVYWSTKLGLICVNKLQ
jgi:hypothetical protein